MSVLPRSKCLSVMWATSIIKRGKDTEWPGDHCARTLPLLDSSDVNQAIRTSVGNHDGLGRIGGWSDPQRPSKVSGWNSLQQDRGGNWKRPRRKCHMQEKGETEYLASPSGEEYGQPEPAKWPHYANKFADADKPENAANARLHQAS